MGEGLNDLIVESKRGANPGSVPLPPEPMPSRIQEQLVETFALAEEAAESRNLTLAERLFRNVIQAAPDGMGRQATLRLAAMRSDQDRKREYQQILQMANNPAQSREARNACRSFAHRYPGYDPNGLARLTADTMPLTPPPGDPSR